jgi:hypothetical protein
MSRAPSSSALALLLVACVVVVLVATGLREYVITNDGPQHAFAGEVIAFGNPNYVQNTTPSANGGVQVYAAVRRLGGSTGLAQTVATDAPLVLWVVGFSALALVLDRRRWPLLLLGAASAFQFASVLGLLQFQLAMGAAMLVLAHECSSASLRRRDAVLVVGVFVVAWFHLIVIPMLALGVVVARATSPSPIAALFRGALAAAPAVVWTAAAVLRFRSVEEDYTHVAVEAWSLVDGLTAVVRDFLVDPPWRGVVAVGITVVAVASLRFMPARSKWLAVAGLLLVIATVLSPENLSSWQLLRPRFLPLGCAFLWVSLPLERLAPRWHALTAAACAVFALTSAGWWRHNLQSQEQQWAPAIAGLSQAPKQQGTWTPLVLVTDGDVELGRFSTWMHIGQLAALTLGGAPAYMQDINPINHQVHRIGAEAAPLYTPTFPGRWPKAWSAEGAERFRIVRALSTWSAPFRNIVAYARPDDVDAIRAGGLVIDSEQVVGFDRVVVTGHFVGCPIDVEFADATAGDVVELGFVPATTPVDAAIVRTGSDVVHFEHGPCGAIWVRSPSCAGEERLTGHADVDSATTTLRCQLVLQPE